MSNGSYEKFARDLVTGIRGSDQATTNPTVIAVYTDGTADVKFGGSTSKLHIPIASMTLYTLLRDKLARGIVVRVLLLNNIITDLVNDGSNDPVITPKETVLGPNGTPVVNVSFPWFFDADVPNVFSLGASYTMPATTKITGQRGYLRVPCSTVPLVMSASVITAGNMLSIYTTNPYFAVGANVMTPGIFSQTLTLIPKESVLIWNIVARGDFDASTAGVTFELFGIR